jgi:acyl-CoA thioesterase I
MVEWIKKRAIVKNPFNLILLIMAFCLTLSSCSSEDGNSPSPGDTTQAATDQITIVAMGDSLTAGLGLDESDAYPAVLERRLKADGHKVRVVNAGVSGETSSGAVSRIDWVLSSLDPDIVILETGANDGLRGIDPEVLSANLNHLLTILKTAEVKVILAGMQMLPNLGPVYTRKFNGVYTRMAKTHDVPLIPFFLENVAGDRRYNQSDMLHPNAEGYQRIVDHIYPWVVAALE